MSGEHLVSGVTTSSSSSVCVESEILCEKTDFLRRNDNVESTNSSGRFLMSNDNSYLASSDKTASKTSGNILVSSDDVDTIMLGELMVKTAPVSVMGSPRGDSSNSLRMSSPTSILAKADKTGYLTDCSENFLAVCDLGDDYKSHSIISLIKFTTPEALQQQAFMLDSLASSDAEKAVVWTAELSNTYMDTSYEIHVTVSKETISKVPGHDLDVSLKHVQSSLKNSFSNSYATGQLCRQASNIVGGMRDTDPSLRILVVDESVIVLKVIRRIIQGEGHIVDCKRDGVEALMALKNIKYDAVLMDINMPEGAGLEASLEFRSHEELMHQYRTKAQSSKLKIIAMSSEFSEKVFTDLKIAGFDGFLSKPLTLEGFRELKLKPSLARGLPVKTPVGL